MLVTETKNKTIECIYLSEHAWKVLAILAFYNEIKGKEKLID